MTPRRAWNGVARRLLRLRYDLRNRRSPSPIAGGTGPTVSLTSHGPRLARAHLAIESIGRGRLRPERLVLWIGDEDARRPLPAPLARLVERGLEVCATRDLGPHTKVHPLAAEGGAGRFATADDDVFYPRRWLVDLVRTADRHPGAVVCHRAHVVAVERRDGAWSIAPYVTWSPCRTTDPSGRHFATGVSGVLYPAGFATVIRDAGTGFTVSAPRADDVWLNALALASGHAVVQVRRRPGEFLGVPGTRATGLYRTNEFGGNDRQIAATYPADAARRLAEPAGTEPAGTEPAGTEPRLGDAASGQRRSPLDVSSPSERA